MNTPNFDLKVAHQYFAVALNQLTWEYLAKKDREQKDNELMEHAAHSSMYHWLQVGKPVNEQRGAWLLSRVYAALDDGVQCAYYAIKCFNLTKEHELDGFDEAYAFEAMYRASLLNDEPEEAAAYKRLAEEAAQDIANEEDRKLFLKDLAETLD